MARSRAVNSAVECHLHTVEVAGSNPAPPTRRGSTRGQRSPTGLCPPVLQRASISAATISGMNTTRVSTGWCSYSGFRVARLGLRSKVRGAARRAMRRLLPVIVGCIAGVAGADTGQGKPTPRSEDLFSSKSAFKCAPAPLGNGTWPKLRSNTAGSVAWWYCPGAHGSWSLSVAAATAAHLSGAGIRDEIYSVVGAPDSVAAFHAAVAARFTANMNDAGLKPVWQPFWPEMRAGSPAVAVKPSNALAGT